MAPALEGSNPKTSRIARSRVATFRFNNISSLHARSYNHSIKNDRKPAGMEHKVSIEKGAVTKDSAASAKICH
jgi:hypothetical protein